MAGTPRPTGIAVLAVLAALGGILCLIGAAVLAVLAEPMTDFITSAVGPYGIPGVSDVGAFISAMIMAFAAISAIAGVVVLIDAYGLWTGKGWAWWLTIILSILGVIGGVFTLPGGVIAIIIDIIIIYYFTRPHVKAFFGVGATLSPPLPPPTPSTPPPQPPPA